MSSGSRYINISSDVAKNHASSWSIKNAGKSNKTSIWPISSYLDRTRLINDANVYESVRMKRLSSSELRSPFSASVVCLFCNKTINNNNNKTRRCKKARPLWNNLRKTPSSESLLIVLIQFFLGGGGGGVGYLFEFEWEGERAVGWVGAYSRLGAH